MDTKSLVQSKTLKIILFILGGLVVILLIFMIGEYVGFRQAGSSYRLSERYFRGFSGPPGPPLEEFREMFPPSYGTSGQIIKVASSTLIVQEQSGTEKIVLVDGDTMIRRLRDTISINDLKVNDNVIVIGSPDNSGQIEARLIRVLPQSF